MDHAAAEPIYDDGPELSVTGEELYAVCVVCAKPYSKRNRLQVTCGSAKCRNRRHYLAEREKPAAVQRDRDKLKRYYEAHKDELKAKRQARRAGAAKTKKTAAVKAAKAEAHHCAYCGDGFVPRDKHQKYCISACADADRDRRPRTPELMAYHRERVARYKAQCRIDLVGPVVDVVPPEYPKTLPGGAVAVKIRGLVRPLAQDELSKLHGLISRWVDGHHDTHNPRWAIVPHDSGSAIVSHDPEVIAKLDRSVFSGGYLLGGKVTLEGGQAVRLRTPEPMPAGLYTARVTALTELTACTKQTDSDGKKRFRHLRDIRDSSVKSSLARSIGERLGLLIPEDRLFVEILQAETSTQKRRTFHIYKAQGISGEWVMRVNSLAMWLLQVAARGFGLGGRVSLGYGAIRVEVM